MVTDGYLIAVPSVLGLSYQEAVAQITAAGLSVGQLSSIYSDGAAAGVVLISDPPGGWAVPGGTPVQLVISRGPTHVVPEVIGMTLEDAEAALAEASLTLVVREQSSNGPSGIVLSTQPRAGTHVDYGPVTVVVSLHETVPDPVGVDEGPVRIDPDPVYPIFPDTEEEVVEPADNERVHEFKIVVEGVDLSDDHLQTIHQALNNALIIVLSEIDIPVVTGPIVGPDQGVVARPIQ